MPDLLFAAARDEPLPQDPPVAPTLPARRHPVAAIVVAAFAGTLAMLITALLVPVVTDGLVEFVLVVGPLATGSLLTLVAWDRWVEHRRPTLGSGRPRDPVAGTAQAAIYVVPWFAALAVRQDPPPPFAGPTSVELMTTAGPAALTVLITLAAWLVLLGIGRVIERRAGATVASRALVVVLVVGSLIRVATLL